MFEPADAITIGDVKEIFLRAVEMEPDARPAYLDDACASPAIRARVQRMLGAYESGDGWLGEFLLDPSDVEPAQTPQRIGRYAVVRRIGAGAMGVVYEGLQESPRRPVAIKVMAWHLAGESAVRRFQREVEILGRLRHSAIAQVYDASVQGAENLPYFVMEFVPEARSIVRFAREQDLSVRERVAMFIGVCEGVHHGHQKGVIHRDLKPDNILVDGAGNPKIIDFGVARILGSDAAQRTMAACAPALVGTLQYMSPEQLRLDPGAVDTRTDAYSLGVVLYELLAGAPPHDLRAMSVGEALALLCEKSPPPLSSKAVPADLRRIVHKAIQRDPEYRYQSAAELAVDLRRFLGGEPILAHPPSLWYQLRLAAARHRVAASAIALTVAIVVLAAVGSTTLYLRAEHHRRIEQRARANAESVTLALAGLHAAVNPATGRGREAALTSLEGAHRSLSETDMSEQPELLAAALAEVGRAELTLGLYEQAATTLMRALAISRQTLEPGDERIASILEDLGQADLHLTAERAGPALTEALAIRRSLHADEHPIVARSKYLLAQADLYSELGEQLLEEALATQRAALGDDHPDTLATITLLAARHMNLGREPQAEALLREALEAQRARKGFDHPGAAGALIELGKMLAWTEPGGESERLIRDGLAIRRAVLGADHPETASAEWTLATVLRDTGRYQEAHDLLQHAQAVFADHLPESNTSRYWIARNLGIVLFGLGRTDEGARWFERAIELATPDDGAPTFNAGWARATMAECLWDRGRRDEAIELMRFALEIMRAGRPNDPRIGPAIETLEKWLASP